ncbi:DNA/RNA non-specific endonuclease [Streptomyces sp. NPDC002133]|uniref:DNA/RNA non-specific endonuclease n=1 Tax=Streptomyces sp. NPDC002133 TaxID=3154409 RepID=UPI0033268CDF
MDRGHLIANRFDGSGEDIRNLAPMYRDVNRKAMSTVEDAVAEDMNSGYTVFTVKRPSARPLQVEGQRGHTPNCYGRLACGTEAVVRAEHNPRVVVANPYGHGIWVGGEVDV